VRERGGHVWLLTGTPLLNRPPELWNVLRAADLENQAFGDFHKFMKLFHAYKSKFGIKWGKPKPEVAECLKNAMLYRRREDVLPDLPTKIWRDIPVRLDREAWMICDELALKLESEGHSLDDMIESNVAFEELSKVRAALARAKIPTLLKEIEIYEDSEEPLIVFSAHREPVDQLALRPGWAAITGDVSHSERTRIVEEFQAGRLKGLALTIQAGGVGITLTMAHQCIFVDLMWTPALNKQAEDRLCRIGQTRGVIVNRLIGNHELDRHVMDVLHKKQMLIEGSVERAAVAT